MALVTGAHVILYSPDADADRAFLRDVLQFPSVDAGRGWLIFALPPAEVAVHPIEGAASHELYLMCDDADALVATLRGRGVACDGPSEERWGRVVHVTLPSGTRLGVYQPKHPTALSRGSAS
jgi:catechol 2,3-dioxygenase-like lactoylglutathione lyase family enzyme